MKNQKQISDMLGILIIIIIIIGIFYSTSQEKTKPSDKKTQVAGNANGVMEDFESVLNNLNKISQYDMFKRYGFTPTGDATGTVRIWIDTREYYTLPEGMKKDVVQIYGRMSNKICADNGFTSGCRTEIYSDLDRLIAEYTLFGNIKLH